MIQQITKKQLKQIKSLRKVTHKSLSDGKLVWIAPNGKAYLCDKTGMEGTREMVEHNAQIKKGLTVQEKLL